MRTYVGVYRIEETLGRGGMGVVYRGLHERLHRTVAIKALASELTQQPEFEERFFAEARTQARLQHPNIVSVYDLLEDGGEFFIVMEYVAGTPLDAALRETAGQGMELPRACGLIGQVLTALDYAHSEAVIHRDVKPSNVLVTDGGRVKLMDFGIALLVGDKRLTSSQATIGTPVYMSPEQILRPRQMDHRTDIYSAAIMLYEMLAGDPPFDAETPYEINKLQIEAPPPDLCERRPDLPQPFFLAIQRALAKDPDDRFVSAGEFLRALEAAAPAAFNARTGQATGSSGRAFVPTVAMQPPRPETASGAGTGQASAAPASGGASAPMVAAGAGGPRAALRPGRRRAVWIAAAAALVLVSTALVLVLALLKPVATSPPAKIVDTAASSTAAAPTATVAAAQVGNHPAATTLAAPAAPDQPEPRDRGRTPAVAAGLLAEPLAGVAAPGTQRRSGRSASGSAATAKRRAAGADSDVERPGLADGSALTKGAKQPTDRPSVDAPPPEEPGPKAEPRTLPPRPSRHAPTAGEAWAACQAKINSGKLDPWYSKEYLPKGMGDTRGGDIDLRLNVGGRSWLCHIQYNDGRIVALRVDLDQG